MPQVGQILYIGTNGSTTGSSSLTFDDYTVYAGTLLNAINLDVTNNISVGGNVGIGTPTPRQALEVNGNAIINAQGTNSLGIHEFGMNGSYDTLSLLSPIGIGLNATASIFFGLNSLIYYPLARIVAADGGGYSASLQFQTGTGESLYERMRIDTTGYVGIGTSTPEYSLDIVGSSRISSSLYVGSTIGIGTSTPQYSLDIVGSSRISSSLYVGSSIGIGTSTPQYSLDIVGSSRISSSLYVGSSIGIGTSTPQCSLDILGDMINFSLTNIGKIYFSHYDLYYMSQNISNNSLFSIPFTWSHVYYSHSEDSTYSVGSHYYLRYTNDVTLSTTTIYDIDGPQGTIKFGTIIVSTINASGNLNINAIANINTLDINGGVQKIVVPAYGHYGCAVNSSGIMYVSEKLSNVIYTVQPDGTRSVLAGSGVAGYSNGNGTNAQFSAPYGVALDSTKTILYVADTFNHIIRKIIIATKDVTTIAGGVYGFSDGNGTNAKFAYPNDVATDSSGNVYVADSTNNRIRKIDINGNVTTIAGDGTNTIINNPGQIDISRQTNTMYITDSNHHVLKLNMSTYALTSLAGSVQGKKDGVGGYVQFNYPYAICVTVVDSQDNVYVSDKTSLRMIMPDGTTTTILNTNDITSMCASSDYTYIIYTDISALYRINLPINIGQLTAFSATINTLTTNSATINGTFNINSTAGSIYNAVFNANSGLIQAYTTTSSGGWFHYYGTGFNADGSSTYGGISAKHYQLYYYPITGGITGNIWNIDGITGNIVFGYSTIVSGALIANGNITADDGIVNVSGNLEVGTSAGSIINVSWNNNSALQAAYNTSASGGWSHYYGNGSNGSGSGQISGIVAQHYQLYYYPPDGGYVGNIWRIHGPSGQIQTSVGITTISDLRTKTNIVTIDSALEKINQLRGVYYTRKTDATNTRQIGVIAQEVEPILPEVVITDDSEEKMKSVAYANIVALLIEGMKEQKKIIQAQQSSINALLSKF